MDYEESAELVQKYLDLLEEDTMYHDISELPCSPTRLKMALNIFTENIIREYERNPDKYDPFEKLIPSLNNAYAVINIRFLDRGNEINKIYNDVVRDKKYEGDKLKKVGDGLKEQYGLQFMRFITVLPDAVAFAEYHNFVAEIIENTNLEK